MKCFNYLICVKLPLIYKFTREKEKGVKSVQSPEVGGGLPIMAYTGRLRPKGVPFSDFRCIKG